MAIHIIYVINVLAHLSYSFLDLILYLAFASSSANFLVGISEV